MQYYDYKEYPCLPYFLIESLLTLHSIYSISYSIDPNLIGIFLLGEQSHSQTE